MAKKAQRVPLKLTAVADLKARGASWDKVAEELNLKKDTINKWPRRYRMPWAKALGAARRDLRNELMAESLLQLRQLLRSERENIVRDSATRLLQYFSGQSRKPRVKRGQRRVPADDFQRIATHLGSLDNDGLQRVYSLCLREPGAASDGAPVVENPTSPA